MKIAIITLIGLYNNGNRLQNYALQETLKEVFPNAKIDTINLKYNKSFKSKCVNLTKIIIKKIIGRRVVSPKKFKEFNKNISFNPKSYYEFDDFSKLVEEYDFFITGSDQVWNLGYLQNEKYYFLDWVPSEKKLSYAASIGNNDLTNKQKAIFKTLLKSYKFISVREKQSEKMLKSLGIKNVITNIDPTLILSEDKWSKLAKKPNFNFKKEFIFVYLLGKMNDKYKNKIKEISKAYNLEIINLYDKKNKIIYNAGPSEFIWLIKNAKLVITDSFHSIVFSIINKTPFVHFNRQDKGASAKINSRIENLERIFNCKFNDESNLKINDDLFKFCIPNPEETIKNERKRSFEYLKSAIERKTPTNLNEATFNCSGCGLCANICPKNAIEIKQNSKGFYEYSINESKCSHCGLCYKLCPANKKLEKYNFKNSIIYGAKNKTPINDNSSSAGVFGKLASYVINKNGIVYGLSYNENNEFLRVDNLQDLEQIKGSKYFQANISTIYPKIEKDLKDEKLVLVCSTPCQTAGLKQKFGKYENLILISIVCHGTPSRTSIDYFSEEFYGEKPSFINFRKKNPYWDDFYIEYRLTGKNIVEKANENIWFKQFLINTFLNTSCYNCNFAGKNFGADILLGDFWGIKSIDKSFYDKYGTSICIIESEKGSNLFNEIKNDIIFKEFNYNTKIYEYNPCIANTNYGTNKIYSQELFFINKENGLTFKENINNINNSNLSKKPSFIKRALRKIKRILFK